MKVAVRLLVCMTSFWVAGASAHHSTAEFDYDKVLTISGSVKENRWTNPHCYVYVSVVNDKGAEDIWQLEYGTPTVNSRMGWKKSSLQSGDKVAVTFSPVRDGRLVGTLRTVTLPDGQMLRGVADMIKPGKPNPFGELPSLPPAGK